MNCLPSLATSPFVKPSPTRHTNSAPMEHAFSENGRIQFVRNGPHLPESLLQAHEDGRVVFFCGAGISCPVLPDFAGLVKELYAKLKPARDPRQERAIKIGQYDVAVDLLDEEITGGRMEVRRTLANILKIPTKFYGDTVHESLLELGKNLGDGSTRLVTTNFDRLFEKVIAKKRLRGKCFSASVVTNFDWLLKKPATYKPLEVERFEAPNLPSRKKQWDGLVYLHGLLAEEPAPPSEPDHLVVSSSDFGRAYFTERWASRFVSELFRNYIVCFVGYSLNDPMLRYITGAIAAEREQGVSTQEMFAFGHYSKGKEKEQRKEWEVKKVTPILYLKAENKENKHAHLLETLQYWSKAYRGGVKVKECIVAEYAERCPLESTKEDDFVSRMIWALSDPSGLPAKRFAEPDLAPSLNWLTPMSKELCRQTGLGSFGAPTKEDFGGGGTSSLLNKPSPSKWNQVIRQLAPWLTRHLNNPTLLLWMAEHDYLLHHILANPIESQLKKLSRLKLDGNATGLKSICSTATEAILGSPMRTLWRLLLTGRVSSAPSWIRSSALYLWKTRFRRYGLTTALRLELRECLTPRAQFPLHKHLLEKVGYDCKPEHIKKFAGQRIVPFADKVLLGLEDLAKDKCWIAALHELLTEFSSLLRDALDLMRELGSASDRNDPSCDLCPSISKHAQNTDPNDWTCLISLTRDAWLFTAKQSPERALDAAEAWSQESYPLFRRLALFAATQGKTIPRRQGLGWLLADEHRWLWVPETRRETMRLLVALAPQLTKTEMVKLEKAILDESHTNQARLGIVDWDIWLRLAKIDQARATLGKDDWLSKDGRKKFAELCTKHPKWKPAKDEHDEFPFWISVTDGGNFVGTPPRPLELVEWLKQPTTDHRQVDDWQQRCQDNFATTAYALCALAKEGVWPGDRWSMALQEWSREKLIKTSWRYMAPVLTNATDEQLQPFSLGLSRWLNTIAKTFVGQEEIFLALCKRVLTLKHKDETGSNNDFVTCATNHPVGCVTKALLSWRCRKESTGGQGLPGELKPTFTLLCDRNVGIFRHGRVFLAAGLMPLLHVDRDWATKHLLPLFDWQASKIEACAAWQGFLWHLRPSHYHPLMQALKPALLGTASHYKVLVNCGRRRTLFGEKYTSLLTFAALNWGDAFENKGLATATRALPPDGLHYAAQELVRTIEGAGERRANYWRERGAPYMRKIWPKTRDKIYPAVTTDLGRVCVAAQDAFPEAFDMLKHWLQPTTDPANYCDYGYLVQRLNETTICSQFPEQALDFLVLVIPKQPCWIPEELGACLKAIRSAKTADPELETDGRYRQLMVRAHQQEAD